MPTFGVLGKYGSGKSNFGTATVIRQLKETDKPIVTTLALNVPALNELVQSQTSRDCRVTQRVYILTQEQMKKFWRYRGIKAWGEYGPEPVQFGNCSQNDVKSGPYDPSWNSVADGGVCYHIDEAPRGFHPRMWAETGLECSDYIDQHRRCGDEVYFYARSSSKLDKQLRLALDSCITLDNWYQRVKGMFRATRKIVARYYEECPPDRGDEPYKVEDMFIDAKGISGCYWTERGVGVQGTVADKGRKSKGLHWSWAIVGVAAACLAVWFGIHYAMYGAMWYVNRKSVATTLPAKSVEVATPLGRGHVPRLLPASAYGDAPVAAPSAVALASVVPMAGPKVFGWARAAGRFTIETEDGLIEGSRMVISNRWLLLDGVPFERSRRKIDLK